MITLKNISSFYDQSIKNLSTDIKNLHIDNNQISSFKGCENLPKSLEELYIYSNNISSFEGCENLPRGLRIIFIYNSNIRSFKGCENLPRGLRVLYLWSNKNRSFKDYEGLPGSLETFELYNNLIYNIGTSTLDHIKHYQKYQNCLLEILQHPWKREFRYPLYEITSNPKNEAVQMQLQKDAKLFMEDPDLLFAHINSC